MSKAARTLVAVAGSLAVAASAHASEHWLELPIDLGDIAFPADAGPTEASPVFEFRVPVGPNEQPVIGFRIDFDYTEPGGNDDSWASDLDLRILSPRGQQHIIGASTFPGEDPFGTADLVWDFDGFGSDGPGSYTSTFYPFKLDPEQAEGMWVFDLADSYDAGTAYSNVTVTLLQVPAPPALALLGMAGLVTRRRRRR